MAHLVRILESYRDGRSWPGVAAGVTRLLERVPERHLAGLHSVVLTSGTPLNHAQRRARTRRRGRKVRLADAPGLYQPAWNGHPASIELRVDEIFDSMPFLARRFGPIRTLVLGWVLFHEVGHHIDATHLPEHREREDVADDWQRTLVTSYVRRRYGRLLPLVLRAVRLMARLARWLQPERTDAGPTAPTRRPARRKATARPMRTVAGGGR